MRRPVDNPFMPGADAVPLVWAGRAAQLQGWRGETRPRLEAGSYVRGKTILGEPGLGKSTLVNRISEQAHENGDWVTGQVRIPSGADPLRAVAAALLGLADQAGLAAARDRRIGEVLARVQQVKLGGVALALASSAGVEPYVALTEILVELGAAAIAARKVVVLHIDEVQNINDDQALSQLLIALGDAGAAQHTVELPGGVQRERYLPLAVFLTGLPEFAGKATSRSGASFSRRFETTTLTPISDEDFLFALNPLIEEGWEVPGERGSTERIRLDPDAAEQIVEVCRGEPFLFQLAGERAWDAGRGQRISREDVLHGWQGAEAEAAAHVERTLDRLPNKEREFVQIMARLPQTERTLTRISKDMGYTRAENAGPFAQRLDTIRGVISRKPRYVFQHRALEAYLTSDWPQVTAGPDLIASPQAPPR